MTSFTCTVGPSAVTNERCGKPAVHSFQSHSGITYHECAEHNVLTPATPKATSLLGASVEVRHLGHVKVGTVVRVGRTRVDVEIPIRAGKDVKVITRPLSEIVVL